MSKQEPFGCSDCARIDVLSSGASEPYYRYVELATTRKNDRFEPVNTSRQVTLALNWEECGE